MESKWEESLGLVTRKDFFEEKQLVTLRAQHQMAGCAQHVNLQRLMPRTDVHWFHHIGTDIKTASAALRGFRTSPRRARPHHTRRRRRLDWTPFRFCPKCHAKYPYTDQHRVCNLCLLHEHREDTCEACRTFRSKKTLRDRRSRRLQMASKPKQHLEVEEEEMRISIQGSDSEESDGDRPSTARQKVSTPSPSHTQGHTKKLKATGTPLPEGDGSTHRKEGDQVISALKKAKDLPKTSDSGRETGTKKSLH
ncbi:hypothetical protein NDU88_007482 [Pleurodeles waltl]|uniref:Uncharacterized protein n=1 Tax=Pleurodeles waltl TaxID=8319 RepID=A0AAV7QKS9_PLEWA|nr:hypothetical protein NDU88_007482 [Pleurodeles waltl]